MAQDLKSEFKRPLPMALAALAAVGWLVVLIVLVTGANTRSELRADLAASQAARTDLQAEVDERRRNGVRLEDIAAEVKQREQVLSDIAASQTAAEAELAKIESDIATKQTALDEQVAAAAEAEDKAKAAADRQSTAETRLAELEKDIAARSTELAAIGERLEAARQQESETRASLAAITGEASALSGSVAEAESRMQAAREAEAEAERMRAQAAAEADQNAAQKTAMEQAIGELQTRRDALAADVSAAEEHRAALQKEVTDLADTLAARGKELAALEERIGAGQADSVEASALNGLYRSERLAVTFDEDGTFHMSDRDGRREVSGRYKAESGTLTMSEASGNTGDATFPLECGLSQTSEGFTLDASGPCGPLSGLSFSR